MSRATVHLRTMVIVVVVVIVEARMQWLLLIIWQLIIVVVVIAVAKVFIPLLSIASIVVVAARIEVAIFPFVDGIGMFGTDGVRAPLGGAVVIGLVRWISFSLLAFLFVAGFGFGRSLFVEGCWLQEIHGLAFDAKDLLDFM